MIHAVRLLCPCLTFQYRPDGVSFTFGTLVESLHVFFLDPPTDQEICILVLHFHAGGSYNL